MERVQLLWLQVIFFFLREEVFLVEYTKTTYERDQPVSPRVLSLSLVLGVLGVVGFKSSILTVYCGSS